MKWTHTPRHDGLNRPSPVPSVLQKPRVPAGLSCGNTPASAGTVSAICTHVVEGELHTTDSLTNISLKPDSLPGTKYKMYDSYSCDDILVPPNTGKCQTLNLILPFRASYAEIHF